MKTDIKGCSTCPAGQENYEEFRCRGKSYIQYDYRKPTGELFSTVGKTIEICRDRKEKWLQKESEVER